MPANYILNGDGTVSFGAAAANAKIAGAAPTAIGYVTNAGTQHGSDKWEGRDENGNVVVTVMYNQNGEISLEMLLKTGATLPKVGDSIFAGEKTGVIEQANQQWSNQEGTKLSITGRWYAGITPSAA